VHNIINNSNKDNNNYNININNNKNNNNYNINNNNNNNEGKIPKASGVEKDKKKCSVNVCTEFVKTILKQFRNVLKKTKKIYLKNVSQICLQIEM